MGCGSAAFPNGWGDSICCFTLSLLPQPGVLPHLPLHRPAPHAADWGGEGLLQVASLTQRLSNPVSFPLRTCSLPSPHWLSFVSIHLFILLVTLLDTGSIVAGKRDKNLHPHGVYCLFSPFSPSAPLAPLAATLTLSWFPTQCASYEGRHGLCTIGHSAPSTYHRAWNTENILSSV